MYKCSMPAFIPWISGSAPSSFLSTLDILACLFPNQDEAYGLTIQKNLANLLLGLDSGGRYPK